MGEAMRARSLITGVLAAVTVTGALVASSAAVGSTTPSPPWHLVYKTHMPQPVEFLGLVAVGPSHAWAIGQNDRRGFVLRWNGNAWAPMPGYPGRYEPIAVTATSPTDLWVFSATAAGIVADRWNGRKWSSIPAITAGTGVAAVASPTDVWYSDGALYHWNGVTWSRQLTRTPVALATGPGGRVWEAFHSHRARLMVRRWNGTKWIAVQTPHPAVFADGVRKPGLIEISVASARNIAVLYRTAVLADGHTADRVLLRTGGRWHVTSVPPGLQGVIAATGSRMAWIGTDGFFNGRTWTRAPLYGPSLVAGVPGTSAAWAVGHSTRPSQPVQGLIWLSGKL
jgi:hypothetical protein